MPHPTPDGAPADGIATTAAGSPSDWVRRHLPGVAPGGSVLDVACGRGRHLCLAHALGHVVTGVDRTLDGVAHLAGKPGIELVAADLEGGGPWPFAGRTFDAVVVTNYLWRPLFPALRATVSRTGLLIYETFARGHERHGSPRNPDFLLRPGELLAAVAPDLVPVAYEHVALAEPERLVARIVAVGPDHKWLIDPPRA